MSSECELDEKWYCLRTQTKREHIAAAALGKVPGVEVFCPRIRFKKPTRRGVIWWIEPLFPGYLLARFDLVHSLRDVLHTSGVSGAVQFGGKLPEVPAGFIADLKSEFDCEGSVEQPLTVARKLGVGDEVEMADGAFQGLNGVVLEVISSEERVRVLLEFMGESRPVNVDVYSLIVRERAE